MVGMTTVTLILTVLVSPVLHACGQTTEKDSYGTDCSSPSEFRNGVWLEKTNPKTILFNCHNGYQLKGSEQLLCLSNGTWDPQEMPTCVEISVDEAAFETVSCKKPFLMNGNIKYMYSSDFKPGDSILVQCNDHYAVKVDTTLVEVLKLYCSEDGKWVTSEGWLVNPECSVSMEMCQSPKEIRHGDYFIHGSSMNIQDAYKYKLSSIDTYKCHAGYRLIGPSSIECLQGSRWSNNAPQCISLQESSQFCESVKSVYNGQCICDSQNDLMFCEPFFEGMHVECVCNEGYKLVGQSIVTCESNGKWDYIMPSCIQDMEINDQNNPNGSSGRQSHMSTLAIVVATACSVLGVLLLIMVIMVFRRRKPHPPRLCRPSSVPPPYSRVHSNSLDEQDRMLLIGYDNAQVALPTYEEAIRGSHQHSHVLQRSVQGQVGEYRPLPNIPTNFRAGQLQSGESTSRHSIITTSTINRDGRSEVFGSIDTVNVSMSDASTAVTIETCDSSSSHHSNVSRRATAGSINSSNGSLVTEDVPLLENNQRSDEINTIDSDDEVHDKPDN